MKTMSNFAAQQLSKMAMNEVKGGRYDVECTYRSYDGVARKIYGSGNTPGLAMTQVVNQIQGDFHTGVTCI